MANLVEALHQNLPQHDGVVVLFVVGRIEERDCAAGGEIANLSEERAMPLKLPR